MNINEKSDMKTADKNSELKIKVEEDEKKKESFFIIMIIKQQS